MSKPTIICPYLFEEEIKELQLYLGWHIPVLYYKDDARIGSDLAYQWLWNNCDTDIIIMHSDILPIGPAEEWYESFIDYSLKYPEAGMIGGNLLYPAKDEETNKYLIQCAGGKFNDFIPDHFGSGYDIFTQKAFKDIELDNGQYDSIREVAWTTFGHLFIRREVLRQVGNFDPTFEGTYNRDVDYCLQARNLGWKIYQTPIKAFHFESKDNKRLRQQNPEMNAREARNLQRLVDKWKDSGLMETINKEIN